MMSIDSYLGKIEKQLQALQAENERKKRKNDKMWEKAGAMMAGVQIENQKLRGALEEIVEYETKHCPDGEGTFPLDIADEALGE